MDPKLFQDYTRRIVDNCSRVIVGKEEVIRQVVVSFLCGGHVLTGVSMKSGGIIWLPAISEVFRSMAIPALVRNW